MSKVKKGWAVVDAGGRIVFASLSKADCIKARRDFKIHGYTGDKIRRVTITEDKDHD